MKLRSLILLFLLVFGLTPLILAVMINLPLVLDRTALFYQKAYLQNLRADFRDLDQHLASRNEMIRLLAKLPEPGLILGEAGDENQTDLARARYTAWINQILGDQRDIIQILFLGPDGGERFWLTRDPKNGHWSPSAEPPQAPSGKFVDAGLRLQPGAVLVSRIRVDTGASSANPRQLMTLDLIGVIGGETAGAGSPSGRAATAAGPATQQALGAVVITIDVGGLAQFYRDTLWVNANGSYLRPGQAMGGEPQAFHDFPGLEDIFAEGKLALWRGDRGAEMLWVPMFLTEAEVPLWVGRPVDPSPIASFRNALMLRVLSIILLLILVVLALARWSANRVERFGQELAGGIGRVLRDGRAIHFRWKGPREVRELAENLTALSESHADFLRAGREHTQELEQSNRYKSEFLANVSHELRTPLNSILLLSKMLSDAEASLPPQQRRQAEVIHEAGRDLRTMIDNILDISRIEAGQIAVSLEWIELQPLLDELVGLMGPLFEDKGLPLSVEVASEAPRRIYSDREKVRQVLKNFLSNAVKFTDQGGVTISLLGPGPDGCPPGHRRDRHRHRHPQGQARHHLRGLPAGRWFHAAPLRRHRPGAVHQPRAGPNPWRTHRGGQHRGSGLSLHPVAARGDGPEPPGRQPGGPRVGRSDHQLGSKAAAARTRAVRAADPRPRALGRSLGPAGRARRPGPGGHVHPARRPGAAGVHRGRSG